MERERYTKYIKPETPHVEWTDEQLFDEVDWLVTHRNEVRPTGERAEQLKRRMAAATFEQMMRYNERKADEENQAWLEHGN